MIAIDGGTLARIEHLVRQFRPRIDAHLVDHSGAMCINLLGGRPEQLRDGFFFVRQAGQPCL